MSQRTKPVRLQFALYDREVQDPDERRRCGLRRWMGPNRIYRVRLDPITRYQRRHDFISRCHLTPECVLWLADTFARHAACTTHGDVRGKGIPILQKMTTVTPSGRLMIPASRASGWRRGWPFPKNNEDNMLNCGGAENQWETHDGKCGVCGDPWQGPREHETGGKFATGVTTQTLTAGNKLMVTVELTNNKNGWFEFRICAHDYADEPVSQACLNDYLLTETNLDTSRIKVSPDAVWIDSSLQLPPDLTCTQCVLQWKYQTGNVKDDCSDCAGKEQFYGCADIRIMAGPSTIPPPTQPTTKLSTTIQPTTQPTTTPSRTRPPTIQPTTIPSTTIRPTTQSTTKPSTTIGSTTQPTTTPSTTIRPTTQPTTTPSTTIQPTTQPTKSPSSTQPPKTTTSSPIDNCAAAPGWDLTPGMDKWCEVNCAVGNCPSAQCICPPFSTPDGWEDCTATPAWKKVEGMITWCRYHCRVGNCPKERCVCITSTTSYSANAVTVPMRKSAGTAPVSTITSLRHHTPLSTVNRGTPTVKVGVNGAVNKLTSMQISVRVCRAVGHWENIAGMNRWCELTCGHDVCPAELCHCTNIPTSVHGRSVISGSTTTAKDTRHVGTTTTTVDGYEDHGEVHLCPDRCCANGVWRHVKGLHGWCQRNCRRSFCPATHCLCVPKL